jgi:glutamine amidotransferase
VKTAVVRYNAGNVESVRFALGRIGVEPLFTDDAEELRRADRVIFPGVGEASSAMRYLRERGLDSVISGLRQPVLGICLGLQLLCDSSEEGATEGMGVFTERVERFSGPRKVPHVGWNAIRGLRGNIFEGVPEGSYAYFVHSFRARCGGDTSAVCDYGGEFSAALSKGNFCAVQFHPEKSGPVGQKMLENFISRGV